MESNSSVSLMIMYEDESVDVGYGNGSQLQLSPCGCEFMLVKAPSTSGHPLQTAERVRQRTRFTISAHKELLIAALAFRNKYASRPYLPVELIPAANKQPFSGIGSHTQWPEWSSSDVEFGSGGETIVRSEDGQAVLMLSPSAEEFSIRYPCRLSQPHHQNPSMQYLSRDSSPDSQQQQGSIGTRQSLQSSNNNTNVNQGRGQRRNEPIRSRSCSPPITSHISGHPKPEEMYQSTTVVQHHSCLAIPPTWCYPLSLARYHWTARLSKPIKDIGAEGTKHSSQADRTINTSDITIEDRRSLLSQALPLTCPSPHWHRWRVKDPLSKTELSDQDSPTELVKVVWCQGVTYRILSGAVAVIVVSLGDGSVIQSNGVLNNYFIHHKPELLSAGVKKITYHLNSLPPDVPGQTYSIRSVVSQTSRILTCYNEAMQSLKLPCTPSCLQEDGIFSKLAMNAEKLSNPVLTEQHVNDTQTLESLSDVVATELGKIKRFNFLLENSNLQRSQKGCAGNSSDGVTQEPASESCVAEALQRTSKVIQDIDALISAATLT